MGKENLNHPGLIPISPDLKRAIAAVIGIPCAITPFLTACQRPKPAIAEPISLKETPLSENLIQTVNCDIKVIRDYDPQHDVNISEIRRLFEDNGVDCPYWVGIKLLSKPLWIEKTEKGIQFSSGRVRHLTDFYIIEFSTNEMELVVTEGHDFSILKTLRGRERSNWVAQHEFAHLILYERGLPADDELWCDQFANENYKKYNIK